MSRIEENRRAARGWNDLRRRRRVSTGLWARIARANRFADADEQHSVRTWAMVERGVWLSPDEQLPEPEVAR